MILNLSKTETKAQAETERPTVVKNAGSRYFSAVDLEGGAVEGRLGDGRYPHTAHFHPDLPLAYLLYISSAHLEVVDLESLETVQRVEDVGTVPVGSSLDADESRLYVGTAVDLPNHDEAGVLTFEVDDEGRVERGGETVLGRCSGMRVAPDGRVLAGLKRQDEVAALTAEPEPEVVARYDVGEAPHDMYVLEEDDAVVVNNSDEASASFVDLSSDEVLVDVETGENPHGFAVADGDGYRYGLFPARDDERFAVVDLEAAVAGEADATEALVDVETTTGFAATTPDARYAVVDSYDHDRVTILDLEELEPVEQVEIGGEPLHVVFSDDGSRCYVGNMDTNYLAVLDTSALADRRPEDVEVVDRIQGLGEQPSGIFRSEVDA